MIKVSNHRAWGRPHHAPDASRGFSLIELLVVLVLLGIIATLVVPNIMEMFGVGKHKAAEGQVETIQGAVSSYQLTNPSLPDSLDDLVNRPSSATNWIGPYIDEAALKDPWGEPWHYRLPGQNGRRYDIYSYGADKAPGGEGVNSDITSW